MVSLWSEAERGLLVGLDAAVRSRDVAATIEAIASRVAGTLARDADAIEAWEPIPLPVYGDLAARGQIARLPGAFQQPDPLRALSEFVRAFIGFWASGRLLLRRLRGMGAIDAELGHALRARDERRRHGLTVLVQRIAEQRGRSSSVTLEDIVDVLFTLTSFETFDALARGKRSTDDVRALVERLVLAAVGSAS